MTFTDFIPPKTWSFIVRIADDNKLSTKEVERILLNKVARDLGMTCDHERVGRAKKDPEHKPYCKDCWARLRSEKREPYRIGDKLIKQGIRYIEKETFLDEFYRDREEAQIKAERKSENMIEGINE